MIRVLLLLALSPLAMGGVFYDSFEEKIMASTGWKSPKYVSHDPVNREITNADALLDYTTTENPTMENMLFLTNGDFTMNEPENTYNPNITGWEVVTEGTGIVTAYPHVLGGPIVVTLFAGFNGRAAIRQRITQEFFLRPVNDEPYLTVYFSANLSVGAVKTFIVFDDGTKLDVTSTGFTYEEGSKTVKYVEFSNSETTWALFDKVVSTRDNIYRTVADYAEALDDDPGNQYYAQTDLYGFDFEIPEDAIIQSIDIHIDSNRPNNTDTIFNPQNIIPSGLCDITYALLLDGRPYIDPASRITTTLNWASDPDISYYTNPNDPLASNYLLYLPNGITDVYSNTETSRTIAQWGQPGITPSEVNSSQFGITFGLTMDEDVRLSGLRMRINFIGANYAEVNPLLLVSDVSATPGAVYKSSSLLGGTAIIDDSPLSGKANLNSTVLIGSRTIMAARGNSTLSPTSEIESNPLRNAVSTGASMSDTLSVSPGNQDRTGLVSSSLAGSLNISHGSIKATRPVSDLDLDSDMSVAFSTSASFFTSTEVDMEMDSSANVNALINANDTSIDSTCEVSSSAYNAAYSLGSMGGSMTMIGGISTNLFAHAPDDRTMIFNPDDSIMELTEYDNTMVFQ